VDLVRLTDSLDFVQAQSTALVVSDVPGEVVDRYRLYVVLKNSPKAVITGTFSIDGLYDMRRMLEVVAAGQSELARRSCPCLSWAQQVPQRWLDHWCSTTPNSSAV